MFIGGVGSFWISALGRIVIGPLPVSLSVVGWWALGGVVVGIIVGACFPKVVSTLIFPFSTIGIGN
jgi:hypothetical protein